MKYTSLVLNGFSLLCLWGLQAPVVAQVVEDATLPSSSRVRAEGNRWVITAGTQRGTNLFHSFRQFSPGDGAASFQEVSPEVANVFARVTGSNPSRINGTIEIRQPDNSISPANLFLLNPNGILFGRNASLNIGGSFIATTADRIRFADGEQFSAIAPQASLLTVSAPIGLQFGRNPGRIANQSTVENFSSTGELLLDPTSEEPVAALGLHVLPGRTLALVGGVLELSGGGLVAGSEAASPGGRIELASVADNAQVSLTPDAAGWRLGFAGVQDFGDVRLERQAIVNASGANGGAIAVHGRRVQLNSGSQLFSVTLGAEAGSPLIVNAVDQLTLDGVLEPYNSFLYTGTEGSGRAGDLQVSTRQLAIRNGAVVASQTTGAGRGGDIQIRASDNVEIDGTFKDFRSNLLSLSLGDGTAGDLQVLTGQLRILNGADAGSITYGTGQGGNVTIQASDSVEVLGISTLPNLADDDRGGNLLSQTVGGDPNAGDAGTLTVITDRVLLQNGGQIAASTFGSGNAGRLVVRAREIDLVGVALNDNGSPFLSSPEDGSLPYPSGLFAGTAPDSTGNGGKLEVEAQQLRLSEGAVLQTTTFGSGDAGNAEIRVRDSIEVSGRSRNDLIPTGIVAVSGGFPGTEYRQVDDATGAGGDINIQTDRLLVEDGAIIGASSINSDARGAGQLQITARTIVLSDAAQLNASTESVSADSATIRLEGLDLLSLQGGSQITTRAGKERGGGNGGNIEIQSAFIVAAPNGNNDISADAGRGNGGNITIDARTIGLIPQDRATAPESGITASSEQGVSGTITISSPEFDPSRSLTALPTDIVDASRYIAQTCRPTNRTRPQSTFVVTGRGGLTPTPYESFSSSAILDDVRLPEAALADAETIVEAQGWRRDEAGNVVLLAASAPVETQCRLQ